MLAAGQIPNPDVSLNMLSISPWSGYGPGPWKDKKMDTQLRLDQLIERGSKRELRVKSAAARLDAARFDLDDAARQQLVLLRYAYYNLRLAQERLVLAQETAALYGKSAEAGKLRKKAGDIAPVDLSRLQIDQARADSDARQALTELHQARQVLAYLIGRDAEAESLVAADSWPALEAFRHLWIGTSNSGIYRYNPISQESVLFDGGLEYPDHSGWTIHAGSNGLLWMGNQEQNVYQIDIYSNKIPYTEENVTALYQESQDVLWKGTPEGLIRMDLTSGLKTYFRHDIHNPHSITSGAIWTILKDHLGFYWIGTTNGLNRLDLKTNKFIRFVHNSNDSSSLSSNDISLIFEDSKQQLWIATYQDGLNRFDRKSEKFTHFRFDPNDPNSQMMDAINAVKVDSEGYFWMALLNNDGVVRFDPVTGSSKKYLSGLTCNALLLDDQHVVWVGADNGFSFYDFQTEDNFVASKLLVPVGSMSKDVFNQIWVGTPKGIHMVSADRLHISLFANKNGVNTDASQHGGWRASSAISMEDKTIMMVNSIGYLYHFDPAEIQIYPDTSILYVTEFNLEGNPRKKSFNEMVFLADEIHLNHD